MRYCDPSPGLIGKGNPTAVWSTKVTKTTKDRLTGVPPAVPGGLAVIPENNWPQVENGEVLLGHFKDSNGRDVIAFASHNAYQAKALTVELQTAPQKMELFDRKLGKWVEQKVNDGEVKFGVEEFATELLRVER